MGKKMLIRIWYTCCGYEIVRRLRRANAGFVSKKKKTQSSEYFASWKPSSSSREPEESNLADATEHVVRVGLRRPYSRHRRDMCTNHKRFSRIVNGEIW